MAFLLFYVLFFPGFEFGLRGAFLPIPCFSRGQIRPHHQVTRLHRDHSNAVEKRKRGSDEYGIVRITTQVKEIRFFQKHF